MLFYILVRYNLQFIKLLHIIISVAWQAWHINSKMNQPPNYQEMGFFPSLHIYKKPSMNYCIQKTKMSRSVNDSFAGGSQRMFTKVNSIDKLHTDLASWSVVKAFSLHRKSHQNLSLLNFDCAASIRVNIHLCWYQLLRD